MAYETIAEVKRSMRMVPDVWAELYFEQTAYIEELKDLLEANNSRLQALLRDPDEYDH